MFSVKSVSRFLYIDNYLVRKKEEQEEKKTNFIVFLFFPLIEIRSFNSQFP